MDEQALNQLAIHIFDKPYPCSAKPMILDAALPGPLETEKTEYYRDRDGVVCQVDHSGDKQVLSALFGHTRYTDDEEANDKIAKTPIDVNLTIDQMVEILDIGGTFTLQNPQDSSEIFDVVRRYYRGVLDKQRYSVHSYGPPKEDMNKLKRLMEAIGPLAEHINRAGEGSGYLAHLLKLFGAFGEYQIGSDDEAYFKQTLPPEEKPEEEAPKDATSLEGLPERTALLRRKPVWTNDPYKF
jgi:hypothetical protein